MHFINNRFLSNKKNVNICMGEIMTKREELEKLVKTFSDNLNYYKDPKNNYNEQTTRDDFISPLLCIFGWDVSNAQGLQPQYKEVIPEKYSIKTDRPELFPNSKRY